MVRVYGQNIKKLIDLKHDNWQNNKTTNCYAFALGLDIPKEKICDFAYNGGVIYEHFTKNPVDISKLTHQEQIELDLKTMELYFEQIDLKDHIYSPDEWKIAFFDCDDDFHFLRETEGGIWYHKYGFKKNPECYDASEVLITNPIVADLEYSIFKYEYKHCYRLSKKKLK